MKLLLRISIRILVAIAGQAGAEECLPSHDTQSFSYSVAYESFDHSNELPE